MALVVEFARLGGEWELHVDYFGAYLGLSHPEAVFLAFPAYCGSALVAAEIPCDCDRLCTVGEAYGVVNETRCKFHVSFDGNYIADFVILASISPAYKCLSVKIECVVGRDGECFADFHCLGSRKCLSGISEFSE